MLIEERKIDVGHLQIGMFVCRLDRDWMETPYLLQGFLIENEGDIEQLRRYCAHVYVDVEKSIDVRDSRLLLLLDDRDEADADSPEEPVAAAAYPVSRTITEEIPHAIEAVERISISAAAIIDALRSGEAVTPEQIAAAVEPVVASLIRNPDAFFWLQALRKHDDYAYGHATHCCALAAALGRQLGLPEAALRDVATGGLLLDIGMTTVSVATLQQREPLTDEDMRAIRRHVDVGATLYRDSGMDNDVVLTMILHHHERHDGSGYPHRQAGNDIPVYARMAGIVDSYDAMISPRPWRGAMSRHDALQHLYRERDRLFQDELIEQFMQCLGVYPVGNLVELNSGEVAIVMAQNPTRRLRPVLMLLTDAEKRIRSHFEPLDLMLADRARLPQAGLKIMRSLQPGAYGLEPTELYL